MGQARQRTQSLLERHPICCFCGGTTGATTVDHQPARALFDRKEWPEGYEFPACESCNFESKRDEGIMAVLVRLAIDGSNPQSNMDLLKYLGGMRNNYPDAIRPLTTREKRQYFKEQGLEKPPGITFAELPMAGKSQMAENAIDLVFTKLIKALHYKHTGKIQPVDGAVVLRWLTNVDFYKASEYQFFIDAVRGVPRLVRGNRDLSSQFDYRYGIDHAVDGSAFMLVFRNSLVGFGIAAGATPATGTRRSTSEMIDLPTMPATVSPRGPGQRRRDGDSPTFLRLLPILLTAFFSEKQRA